ncbi:hypothetical protein [Mesobacterium pallidum]|uniref:hypothetical protein n=1 Tax=Mesobacterium pallidum TaxID=2872037 RepID=UPI001EE15E8E|nr:hypothetical protein [Mesobacterium pallidum]
MSRTFIAGIVAASIAITGLSTAPARADSDLGNALAGLTTLFILGKIISDSNDRKSEPEVVYVKPKPKVIYVQPKPKVVYIQPKKKVVYVHPKTKVVKVEPKKKVVTREVERHTWRDQDRRHDRERHMPRPFAGN